MGKRIQVTRFGLCEQCKRRFKCAFRKKNSVTCGHEVVPSRYVVDNDARKRIDEIHKREVEEFLSKLKLTDRKQVNVTDGFAIMYVPKEDAVRRSNSRSNALITVSGEDDEYIKYCENCGRKIHTVNPSRRLCDECNEEICGYLGVSYDTVKPVS